MSATEICWLISGVGAGIAVLSLMYLIVHVSDYGPAPVAAVVVGLVMLFGGFIGWAVDEDNRFGDAKRQAQDMCHPYIAQIIDSDADTMLAYTCSGGPGKSRFFAIDY